MPPPVLGGAALAMFATVAVVGIQTLARVDFHDHRNVVIVGTSLGLAMFVTAQPGVAQAVPDWAQIIFGSGITLGSLCAILLNLVFHHVGKDFGPAVAGRPGAGVIRLDQVNEMTREEFVDTFGRLVQGPQWVAERAYDQRPFTDTHDLRISFQEALFSSDRSEQHDLFTFYPDLGSDAVEGDTRGEESARDQGAVGLTLLNDEDHEQFARAHPGLPGTVRHPADRLRPGRGKARSDPGVRVGAHAELPQPGARRGHHRGGQDRQPPVRRPGRGRQPDPGRAGGESGGHPAAVHASGCPAGDRRRRADRRCAAVQRPVRSRRHGRRWRPAWRSRGGSTRCRPAGPTTPPGAVFRQARASAAAFSDDEIAAALARHPRIGEQAGAGHDAEFSEEEQAAVGDADPAIIDAIRAGNAEYESRFNRVFVIRATGRSATEILAELRRRLNNTAEAERAEVVTQLREIALTRLETVLA